MSTQVKFLENAGKISDLAGKIRTVALLWSDEDYTEAEKAEKMQDLLAFLFENVEEDPNFIDPSPDTDRLDPIYQAAVAGHAQAIADGLIEGGNEIVVSKALSAMADFVKKNVHILAGKAQGFEDFCEEIAEIN